MTKLNMELVSALKESDISIQPSVQCNKEIGGNVWFISYADGGDRYLTNQRHQIKSGLNKCIDFYKPYNISHIDKEYLHKHKDLLQYKRGGGYWIWKPYIILKTLEEIPENDTLIYLDTSISIIRPLDSLINNLKDHDILLISTNHLNRHWVKRDLLRFMGADNEAIRNTMQIHSGYFVIKNTKFSREFIKKWLQLSENEWTLTDSPSKDEYPDFIEHRHDQSILSIMHEIAPDKRILVLPFERAGYLNTDHEFYIHRRGATNAYSLLFNAPGIRTEKLWETTIQYFLTDRPTSEVVNMLFVRIKHEINAVKKAFLRGINPFRKSKV